MSNAEWALKGLERLIELAFMAFVMGYSLPGWRLEVINSMVRWKCCRTADNDVKFVVQIALHHYCQRGEERHVRAALSLVPGVQQVRYRAGAFRSSQRWKALDRFTLVFIVSKDNQHLLGQWLTNRSMRRL